MKKEIIYDSLQSGLSFSRSVLKEIDRLLELEKQFEFASETYLALYKIAENLRNSTDVFQDDIAKTLDSLEGVRHV